MTTPQISVILPFYNAGNYLERALANIVEEQYANGQASQWELIAVNDGSTDSGASIVEKWAEKYPGNIRLLSQPNSGVSNARNLAIEHARGKYLYFIDADDLLVKGALPLLASIAEKNNADLLRFEYLTVTPAEYDTLTPQQQQAAPLPNAARTENLSAADFLESTRGMLEYKSLWSVWSSLFRTEFLRANNITFKPGLHIGEDEVLMWQTLLQSPRLTLVHESLYMYQTRPGNATNNASAAHLARKYRSFIMLLDCQKQLLADYGDKMPVNARAGFLQSMSYKIQDIASLMLALGMPLHGLYRLMRDYHRYTGRKKASTAWLLNPAINNSAVQRLKARIATKVFLRWHHIIHRNETEINKP